MNGLSIQAENFPQPLCDLRQWVNWRMEKDAKDKLTKVPYISHSTTKASSTREGTWRVVDDVLDSFQKWKRPTFNGVGFVFKEGGGIFGLDCDKARNPITGEIDPEVAVLLKSLWTYTEISQSGEGIHAVGFGTLPGDGKKTKKYELYDKGRYFVMTGNVLPGYPTTVNIVGEPLQTLWTTLNATGISILSEDALLPILLPSDGVSLCDEDVVAMAMKFSERFPALWSGDITAGKDGSASGADMSLCNYLAFWCRKDTEQMDRLFRQSGLMRDKWDERHGKWTYGVMTLDRACRLSMKVYEPRPRPRLRIVGKQGRIMNARMTDPDTGEVFEDDYEIEPLVPPIAADDPVPFVSIADLKSYLMQEEYGDSTLMQRVFEHRVVWDHGRKSWFFWTGHAWQPDRMNQMVHLIGGTLAAVYLRGVAECEKKIGLLQAADPVDEDAIKDHKKLIGQLIERAKGLRTRKRLNNVFSLTQSFLSITGDEWDARPTLLAVLNGVVDLTTGECDAGNPEDYLQTVAPVRWEGLNAPADRWERFLEEMFRERPEMPPFLQRLCGVSIRGDIKERQLPIMYGPGGSNGKDKFFEALHYVLGSSMACAVGSDVLLGGPTRSGAASPHLMNLQGKRMCWVSETNKSARLNSSQVKLLTGGGDVSARALYGKEITFTPSHILWLITNYLPKSSSDDEALWTRLLCIECRERFLPNPNPDNPNEHPRDVNLPEKLQAEASGILAWLVRGHIDWQLAGLAEPEEVRKATETYRSGQDDIASFVEDCCILDTNEEIRAFLAYDAYRDWAGKGAMSNREFGQALGLKYPKVRQTIGWVYQGIKLQEGPRLKVKGMGNTEPEGDDTVSM